MERLATKRDGTPGPGRRGPRRDPIERRPRLHGDLADARPAEVAHAVRERRA